MPPFIAFAARSTSGTRGLPSRNPAPTMVIGADNALVRTIVGILRVQQELTLLRSLRADALKIDSNIC